MLCVKFFLASQIWVDVSGKVLTRLFAVTPKAKEAVIAHYLKEMEETRGIVTADEIRDAALAADIATGRG